MEKLIQKIVDWLFTVQGIIIGLPLMTGAYIYMRIKGIDTIDYLAAVSIAALTLSQMIGLASKKESKVTHIKLDELIHGVDNADDSVAGIEQAL